MGVSLYMELYPFTTHDESLHLSKQDFGKAEISLVTIDPYGWLHGRVEAPGTKVLFLITGLSIHSKERNWAHEDGPSWIHRDGLVYSGEKWALVEYDYMPAGSTSYRLLTKHLHRNFRLSYYDQSFLNSLIRSKVPEFVKG